MSLFRSGKSRGADASPIEKVAHATLAARALDVQLASLVVREVVCAEPVLRERLCTYISRERKRLPVMPTDEKPSRNEDEYFAKQNAELVREMRAKLDAERKKTERSASTSKCPRCGGDLKEQHVDDVKIDECQDCHGVWLDPGELEQLRRVNRARGVSGGVLGSLFKRG